MERTEIYKFVKTIIENGVKNNLKESKIIDGIDKYLNMLNEQKLIDSEYYMIMQIFKGNIKTILEKKMDVDQVYAICLNTIEAVKPLSKETNKKSASLVSKNKDKPLKISNHQDLVDESYNNSSASSCGSKVSVSRDNCASTSESKNSYVYNGCASRIGRSSSRC